MTLLLSKIVLIFQALLSKIVKKALLVKHAKELPKARVAKRTNMLDS